MFALLTAVNGLILFAFLLIWRAAALVDWVRAVWILRKLPRPPGDPIFSGVRRLLTGKRLRVMQKINSEVVKGSGVFYYNILWGHVSFRVAVIDLYPMRADGMKSLA